MAQSREITSVLILIGVASILYFMARETFQQVSDMFSRTFTDQIVIAARYGDITQALRLAGTKLLVILAPLLATAAIMGIGSSVMQIGFLTSWEALTPDLNRINPVSGFQKLMTMRNFVEGIKALFKIVIVGVVAYLIIRHEAQLAPRISFFGVAQIFGYVGVLMFKLIGVICVLLAVLAGLDYFFQRWELEKRMRMTKQEVKEEYKQREGDPLIRSRVRRLQREMAQKRMMEKVPKADVIITNPTHLAVALQYDREKMAAPVMVAKGADFIAEKIKEIAKKHNVPVVENKPLARTLFKTLKIGQAIPRNLYNAVAEVLAYVYKLKGRMQNTTVSTSGAVRGFANKSNSRAERTV